MKIHFTNGINPVLNGKLVSRTLPSSEGGGIRSSRIHGRQAMVFLSASDLCQLFSYC